MSCQSCQGERIISVCAKCVDMCSLRFWGGKEQSGYVPSGFGLRGKNEDYIEIDYCVDCGQIQGEFPLPKFKVKKIRKEKDVSPTGYRHQYD